MSDLWQQRWFYVTAPRGTKWAAAPAFRSDPPPQLASWANVGLDWGPADDVPTMQSRIQELLERDVDFVKIIQVMLVRRILPWKRRPLQMWEFNPKGPRTIQHFFGVTLKGMYKLFFGPQVKCPDTTEDAGLSYNRPDTQVSNLETEHFIYIYHNIILKTVRSQDGSARRRGSGVRPHFPKARLVLQ